MSLSPNSVIPDRPPRCPGSGCRPRGRPRRSILRFRSRIGRLMFGRCRSGSRECLLLYSRVSVSILCAKLPKWCVFRGVATMSRCPRRIRPLAPAHCRRPDRASARVASVGRAARRDPSWLDGPCLRLPARGVGMQGRGALLRPARWTGRGPGAPSSRGLARPQAGCAQPTGRTCGRTLMVGGISLDGRRGYRRPRRVRLASGPTAIIPLTRQSGNP